ncbi:MAG: pyrroline-5-carboxylate reductase [Candidatus Gastranaerophilales bacterium]|nr:pyrroline-5-carboxylate reductase [Candidatus Gastranaerophilales bacterium]MCM1073881.1 pyrroline-5-carboxylate reductase [Bacteroides sp.]
MKKYNKIGFIGCGKMAGAIIRGIKGNGFEIMASKLSPENLEETSKKLGVEITLDNKFLVQNSEVIFLAVKPNQVESVLEEVKDFITPEKLIVSVAAGVTIGFIKNIINSNRVVRVMPNTPVLVGEGMSGICGENEDDINYIKSLMESIGKCVVVDESQIDIVTAISGSGPAFFYKVINDIARAGEKLGLDYEKSLMLSIQTAIGSAKMALNREISMEELISNVATKGGCTRVGVDVMEEVNTENIFYEVIKDTAEKAKALGK